MQLILQQGRGYGEIAAIDVVDEDSDRKKGNHAGNTQRVGLTDCTCTIRTREWWDCAPDSDKGKF